MITLMVMWIAARNKLDVDGIALFLIIDLVIAWMVCNTLKEIL